MGVLCTCVKLLTYLQILGCEFHKNAFGGRAVPRPDGELQRSPRPSSRYKGDGRGRNGLGLGRREGVKGWEGGGSGRGRG